MPHYRLGLDVEVAEHLVGSPPSDETNAVGVDICAQERHGARCSKGARRNIFRKKTVLWPQDSHSTAVRRRCVMSLGVMRRNLLVCGLT
jgi:hypothetical protein